MSDPSDKSAVVKLALKRADLGELVRADDLLKSAGLLKALGSLGEGLLQKATARRYPKSAVLFQQGDAGNSLFFVLRGEVRLSGRKGTDIVELGTAARGDVFGEAEVLSGSSSRSSSAVAQGDVDVAEFQREVLLARGQLLGELSKFLAPISKTRNDALSEMTDFLNRW